MSWMFCPRCGTALPEIPAGYVNVTKWTEAHRKSCSLSRAKGTQTPTTMKDIHAPSVLEQLARGFGEGLVKALKKKPRRARRSK